MRIWRWIKRLFRKQRSQTRVIDIPVDPIEGEFVPSKYREHYKTLWNTMEIRDSKKSTITWYVKTAFRGRERYESVSEKSLVPWQVIASIHLLESGGDFAGILHNGESIIGTGKKTRLVPKNRGPFDTWEGAAIDALAIKKQPKEWTIENTLYYLECYNGTAYLRDSKKPHSPYIWSFSNHYIKGKYVADHKYSATAVSKQCGAAVILKELGYLAV